MPSVCLGIIGLLKMCIIGLLKMISISVMASGTDCSGLGFISSLA
jgi:hypothetical protein